MTIPSVTSSHFSSKPTSGKPTTPTACLGVARLDCQGRVILLATNTAEI